MRDGTLYKLNYNGSLLILCLCCVYVCVYLYNMYKFFVSLIFIYLYIEFVFLLSLLHFLCGKLALYNFLFFLYNAATIITIDRIERVLSFPSRIFVLSCFGPEFFFLSSSICDNWARRRHMRFCADHLRYQTYNRMPTLHRVKFDAWQK